MGMGLRFEQDRHSGDGICAVGRWDLVKIWAGNGNRIPPSGPSLIGKIIRGTRSERCVLLQFRFISAAQCILLNNKKLVTIYKQLSLYVLPLPYFLPRKTFSNPQLQRYRLKQVSIYPRWFKLPNPRFKPVCPPSSCYVLSVHRDRNARYARDRKTISQGDLCVLCPPFYQPDVEIKVHKYVIYKVVFHWP